MNISQPQLRTSSTAARVCSTFTYANGEKHEVFYETTPEFSKYLVSEVCDAFLVAALLPALVNGEDIYVESVSDCLRYNFDPLMYLLGKVFHYNPVKLHAKEVLHINFNPQAVGTGFSGGVDSLSTYLEHTSEQCPENMRVNHLALFNVGSYGNDPQKTTQNFTSDFERATKFATEVNVPLIPLHSNISSIYVHKDIFHYSLRSTLCLSSAILSLQKLFRLYYISSTGTIDNVMLSNKEQYHYENLFIQRLCTTSTDIMISEVHYDRVEKTKKLLQSELTRKHLYVCNADLMNEKWGEKNEKEGFLNCSECFKCVRTLLTLDLLGKLDEYGNLFNLEKYRRSKDAHILKMYQQKGYDHFQQEIYTLFKERGAQFTPEQQRLINAWERKQWPQKIYRKTRAMCGKIVRKLFS